MRQLIAAYADYSDRKKAEDDLHAAQQQVASDLKFTTLLLQLGSLYLREENMDITFGAIVDAVITCSGADFGNIQFLDVLSNDLKIIAQRGFPQYWVDYWDIVSKEKWACWTALRRGERVVIEDIARSSIPRGATSPTGVA